MKTAIANYKVFIKKDKRIGTNKICYSSYVPELGIGTEEETLEKTIEATKNLIVFHLECLVEEDSIIPESSTETIIFDTQVRFQVNKKVRYA